LFSFSLFSFSLLAFSLDAPSVFLLFNASSVWSWYLDSIKLK
jgi:hypothetical protein